MNSLLARRLFTVYDVFRYTDLYLHDYSGGWKRLPPYRFDGRKIHCDRYPHPSVTTDCVIFGFDGTRLQVLLVERGIDPYTF